MHRQKICQNILTYEEIIKKFPTLDSIDEDSETEADPGPSSGEGEDEIEMTIGHLQVDEDDYD